MAQRMAGDGFEFVYVTNRQKGIDLHRQTVLWLNEHGWPKGDLFVTRDKAEALRSFGKTLVAHLDDAPENIEAMRGLGLPVWVRDWPYNRHVLGVPRVGSLGEFLAEVGK